MTFRDRLIAEGRLLIVPGAVYGECWPGAARPRIALIPHQHIDSHLGPIALPGDHPLYLRGSLVPELQMAGQSDARPGTLHYRASRGWSLDPRISHGTSGHIFDRQGTLHIIEPAPHQTSQGFRFVDEHNRLVRGDETYFHPALDVNEYTTHGDVTVGQGRTHVGGAIAIRGSVRAVLEPGHTTFIRFHREGDQLAIAICKHVERVMVFLWVHVDELALFEREPVAQPEPKPDPKPDEPKPEPIPVSTPNRFAVVQAVAAEHGHLLSTNTYASCGEFVQRVLAALPAGEGWGHVGKSAGEAGADLGGVRVSHDVIWHQPSNRQVDIIVAAAARSDHRPEIWQDASIGWEEIPREHYRPSNPWMPPVPLEGEQPKPEPEPQPDPQPIAELDRLRRELAAAHATLEAQQRRLAQLDAERSAQWQRADALEHERNRLAAELAELRTRPVPRCDGPRVFGIRIPCGQR